MEGPSSLRPPRPSSPLSAGSMASMIRRRRTGRRVSHARADRVTHPYLCTTCGQTFRNGRALGGHQNAHRLERISSVPDARHQASPVNAQSNWVRRAMLAQLQFHRSRLLGTTGNFASALDIQGPPSLMQGLTSAPPPYDQSHNGHFNLPQGVHSPPNLTETPTAAPQPCCQNHLEPYPGLIERPTLGLPSHNPDDPLLPSHFAPRTNSTMDTKGKGIAYDQRPYHRLHSGLPDNSSPSFPFSGPGHEEEMAGEFHPGVNLPLPLNGPSHGVVSLTTAGNAALMKPVPSYMLGATVKDLLPPHCFSVTAGSDLPPLLGRNSGGVTLNLLDTLDSHPTAASATPASLDLNLHL